MTRPGRGVWPSWPYASDQVAHTVGASQSTNLASGAPQIENRRIAEAWGSRETNLRTDSRSLHTDRVQNVRRPNSAWTENHRTPGVDSSCCATREAIRLNANKWRHRERGRSVAAATTGPVGGAVATRTTRRKIAIGACYAATVTRDRFERACESEVKRGPLPGDGGRNGACFLFEGERI